MARIFMKYFRAKQREFCSNNGISKAKNMTQLKMKRGVEKIIQVNPNSVLCKKYKHIRIVRLDHVPKEKAD
jgi:hypothetical protein